jgi:uncharacterized protein (TIGR03067 family)
VKNRLALVLLQRRWCFCSVVVLVAALSAGFAPLPKPKERPDPAKGRLKGLQGEWVTVSYSTDGRPVNPAGESVVVQGDRLSFLDRGKVTRTWRVAPGPKGLDLSRPGGDLLLCAYELDGDELRLAYSGGNARPAGVKPAEGVWARVLKRAKPKPKGP